MSVVQCGVASLGAAGRSCSTYHQAELGQSPLLSDVASRSPYRQVQGGKLQHSALLTSLEQSSWHATIPQAPNQVTHSSCLKQFTGTRLTQIAGTPRLAASCPAAGWRQPHQLRGGGDFHLRAEVSAGTASQSSREGAVQPSCVCTAGSNVLLNHHRHGGGWDIFPWDIHSSSVSPQGGVSNAPVYT